MKVVIMPRDRAVQGILSLSFGQCLLCGLVIFVLLLHAGATLQRSFGSSIAVHSGVGESGSSATYRARLADQQALDSLYMQVGVLQANYQRLEVLSQRVAGLAGLPATNLEFVATDVAMTTLKVDGEATQLKGLEQQLRTFQAALMKKTEHFVVLDLLLTKQAAKDARKPTAMPLATFSQLSSTYGWRRHPFHAEPSLHEGLDLAAPFGTPILAASGGLIRTAAPQGSFGNLIEIDHGEGLLTRYAHAQVLMVKKGDLVKRGQVIARVGSTGLSTGPHLHFEIRQHDKPLDPMAYLTGKPRLR